MTDETRYNPTAEAEELEPMGGTDAAFESPAVPAGLEPGIGLSRQVLRLAWWPLLELIMASLVGFVDTALAGHLPAEAVASTNAIGIGSYVNWLIGLMGAALGVGSTAIIARAAGAGRWDEADEALGQSMTAAVVWGGAVGLVVLLAAPAIGMLVGLTGRSLELCTLYLRLVAVITPMRGVLFVGGACLRGAGDTRSPFFIMLVVNVVNIGVSLLLVLGPAPIGGHGLKGIAVGTVAAWAFGGVVMLALLAHGRRRIALHGCRMRPRWAMLKRIIRVGLPNLAENSGMWVGNFVVLMIVGRLGDEAVGAQIIVVRAESLSFLPGASLGLAASILAGQYLGARDPQTARKALWMCVAYGVGLMTAFGVAFIIVPEAFVRLLSSEPVFLEMCPPLLRLAGFAQIGFAFYLVLSGGLRGAGDTRTTMILTFIGTYLVRLPLVYVLALPMGLGLWGVWLAISIELMLRGGMYLGRFLHGGWTKIEV